MRYKLGIDVGGTKIRAVLLDNRNKLIFGFNVATPKDKAGFLNVLEKEIGKIKQNREIFGIGIGLPGIVDIEKGILVKAPYIPYLKNWQAKNFFSKFCKNVKIDNDSRCFLLAEAKLGACRKYKNIVGLAIGTGIGSGIIIDGKMYYGRNNGAGEFGHTIIQVKNETGKRKSFGELAAKEAFLKYGDRSEIIGIGVANIINSVDPEIVVLGGGGITNGGINLSIVKKISKKYIMSPLAKNTPIVRGELKENSQAIGAALMIK